jgi:carbamoyl-phosphate synthase large subunit
MINCNPETVSTDYDTSDRLYFEPLTLEHVLEILRVEQENGTLHGVIVQFGGQTPLKLADALHDAGIPILGTTPDAIDLAEDRERFQALLHRLGLRQPTNGIARSPAQAMAVAKDIGYPLVIRPSYVLGGRAMEIVRDDAQLTRYIRDAVQVSGDTPVLLDRYLSNAIEVDVDAISDGTQVSSGSRSSSHASSTRWRSRPRSGAGSWRARISVPSGRTSPRSATAATSPGSGSSSRSRRRGRSG